MGILLVADRGFQRQRLLGDLEHLARKSLKPRIYPATDDGTMTGTPVFLTQERWEQIKRDQRSTVSAQIMHLEVMISWPDGATSKHYG